ncbi:hypothetical protein RB195_014999 [Necator americanus]|uniref:Uncharacterized protein n=1 Tax=Necator americanus TaxID=51031 RepID=A0ABR1E578_NECAM
MRSRLMSRTCQKIIGNADELKHEKVDSISPYSQHELACGIIAQAVLPFSTTATRGLVRDNVGAKVEFAGSCTVSYHYDIVSQAERILVEFAETCQKSRIQLNLGRIMRKAWVSDATFTLSYDADDSSGELQLCSGN